MKINTDSIQLKGDPGDFTVKKTTKGMDGVQLITFQFLAEHPSELQPVSIRFNFPSLAINGYWNPKIAVDKVNYYYSDVASKALGNAPVLAFYNNALKNRITISLSDALNKSEIVS